MANPKTRIGILLISVGLVPLIVLALLSVGPHLPTLSDKWFGTVPETQRPSRVQITAPIPTGSSELADFYARTPRNNKKKEDPLDSSLWAIDYYTTPDGLSLQKDSNLKNVLLETKRGEQDFKANEQNISNPAQLQQGPAQGNLRVEFWESPVNFKGYKMEGKHLILFGIDPDDALRFEHHTDGIWMHHNQKIYLLRPSSTEIPFEERIPTGMPAKDSTVTVQQTQAADTTVAHQVIQ